VRERRRRVLRPPAGPEARPLAAPQPRRGRGHRAAAALGDRVLASAQRRFAGRGRRRHAPSRRRRRDAREGGTADLPRRLRRPVQAPRRAPMGGTAQPVVRRARLTMAGRATALRPMTETEFAAWQAAAIPAYAIDKVASGQWPVDEADERSAAEYRELLPDGLATPDNHLFTVVDADGAAVGVLWFAVKTKFGARIAYVFDVEIAPGHPRRAHARAAF